MENAFSRRRFFEAVRLGAVASCLNSCDTPSENLSVETASNQVEKVLGTFNYTSKEELEDQFTSFVNSVGKEDPFTVIFTSQREGEPDFTFTLMSENPGEISGDILVPEGISFADRYLADLRREMRKVFRLNGYKPQRMGAYFTFSKETKVAEK